MPDPVKPKRRYRSRRREIQTEATRTAILDAARTLFATGGWAATTIAAIAAKAGVATETVYARFGNKRAIVHALIVTAMRGASPDTPFMEQTGRHVVQGQTDPHLMIDAFAVDVSGVLARVSPVMAVVRAAAESDDEMRELYGELHRSRRRNLSLFVSTLAAIGGLREGLDESTATNHVWSLASPELFVLWTSVEGAGPDEYRGWLALALKRLLLGDP